MHFAKCVSVSLAMMPFVLVHGHARAQFTPVPSANVKVTGVTVPTVLSPELEQIVRAQGSMPVENPSDSVAYFGYLNNVPQLLPASGSNVEASKTEPDKNTYLVLSGSTGPDAHYDYGKHFIYQGHEAGAGQITRVNLDADAAHRVTVLATKEKDATTPLPTFDGSTWDPFSERLLFTAEGNGTSTGGVWQATPDFPSVAENLLGIFGRGGYEGIQIDRAGNVWAVEDIGGPTVDGARQPNSFIYRFVPENKRDLSKGGKLQALQVMSKANPGQPIKFGTPATDILSQDVKDLHTYGKVFDTKWITIHDTATDGTRTFNANALAKTKLATPFKRPENGMFRPGKGFREFFFDETGDTTATTAAGTAFGGFGALFKLSQSEPTSNTGKLSLLFNGDLEHASFDNVAFFDADHLIAVEDRGDAFHTQTALDSGWLFDVRKDFSDSSNKPVRIIAQGRDPSATIDSGLLGTSGFQNEGDNELTGIHVSNGDASVDGLLGTDKPKPFNNGWRVFYTGQHGDNVVYEILPVSVDHGDDDHG